MPAPPTDIPPSDLFLKLLEPQPSDVVDFPRRGADGKPIAKIRIAVLSQDDHDSARMDAHRKLKSKGFDRDDMAGHALQEVLGDAVARELLAKACLSVEGADFEDGKPPRYAHVFQTPEQMNRLRPDEIAVLFGAYMLVQERFGPRDRFIGTPEDLNKWIVTLQEGASEFPLLRLPLPHLVELAFALAERASLLSRILDSQWSSLPDICKSRLAGCSMGIGFYGGLAETSSETGGENSGDRAFTSFKAFSAEMDELAKKHGEPPTTALTATPATTEQAVRLSDELRGKS